MIPFLTETFFCLQKGLNLLKICFSTSRLFRLTVDRVVSSTRRPGFKPCLWKLLRYINFALNKEKIKRRGQEFVCIPTLTITSNEVVAQCDQIWQIFSSLVFLVEIIYFLPKMCAYFCKIKCTTGQSFIVVNGQN